MASESDRLAAPSEPSPCPTAERIAAFIDGALSPSAQRGLERHLAVCPPCRRLVSTLCQLDSQIGSDRASSIAETIVDPASSSSSEAGDPPAPREPALVAGTRIGRYAVLERIGAGAMGVVYAALDPELDRKVAIKILRGDRSDARSRTEHEARLRDEARAMAQLAHPNVVAVFEIDRFHDQVFLVMELVAGQTLAQWLHDKPRGWRKIVEVFAAAGQGLAAAHAAGLVHRDFKPVNVLVGLDGRARVTDFGLVQDGTLPGERHRIAGTPGYMAPEQFRGDAADARTDQFNFCVALYRALYRQRPFAGDTLSELADEVTSGRLRPPPPARVPRWLGRVVVRGLSHAPEDRHRSMPELLRALQREPPRRLRRALAAAASVAAIAAALIAWRASDSRPACDDAANRIFAAWNAERWQQVARAFLRSDRPFAPAAFAEVAHVLDAYRKHWAEMRIDLCQTAQAEPSGSELVGLRSACLDGRLTELRSFVAVLATADADVIQRAPGAAHQLADLDDCANPRALLGPVPPADPAARAQIAALRDQLADAKALHTLGRYTEARELARGLLAAVRATHDRPLEAETQLAIGMAAFESGDYAGIEPALNAALFAAEAGRSDAIAVRTLLYRMYYQGILQGHYEQAARDDAPRIQAILERLGGDAALEGNLHVVLGWMWLGASRFADAEREGKRALELLEGRFGPRDIRIAPALHTRISVAVVRADTATAVSLAGRLLAIRIRLNGDDHPDTAAAHQLLGVALEHTSRAGDARAELARAEAIYRRMLGPDHPEMADVYNTIASYDAAMGRMAEALDYDRHMLAIVEKTSGAQSRQYGEARLAMAQILADLDRDDEALTALDEARTALGPSVGEDSLLMSDQRLTAAVVLGRHGRYVEARRDADASLATLGRLLGPDHPSSALRHRALGEIDLATGRSREALAALERARTTIDRDDGTLVRVRADIDFGIARALAALDRDPSRAHALAESARATYAGYPELEGRRQRIERWLARHPVPAR